MAYHFVTVTGTYTDEQGNAVTGKVDFSPSAPVVDTTAKVTLAPVTLDVQLVNGVFSASLLAMDNSSLSPFTWIFRPYISNVPLDAQYLEVLFANGATQDITGIPSAPDPFG